MYNIPLIKPYITEELKQSVCDVLDSGYLTEGPVTREFEEAIRDYVGCKHAIAFTSCTTGLEVALRSLGVGPGDEVIVPDYTYPATASVVNIVGAKGVIVDVDPSSMNIDYDALAANITPRTKAVIPVSLFGNPLDYSRLNALKQEHGFYIVEDAACSLGSSYGSLMTGALADISVFSFHPRKFITTGEGGGVTTNNPEWAEWMISYKHFGMGQSESRLFTGFNRVGTNYKLSNVQAAIGLSQMGVIEALLEKRRILAGKYVQLLKEVPGVELPRTVQDGMHSYQSFPVFVNDRDRVMAEMREQGVEVQIGTYSLHMHTAFQEAGAFRIAGSMEGSSYAFNHCLVLPLFHDMTDGEMETVVHLLQKVMA